MEEADKSELQKEWGITVFPQVDAILQDFVRVVNKFDLGIGITLTVGGNLVTGQLISSTKYFKLCKERFAAAGGDSDLAQQLSSFMAKHEDDSRAYMASGDDSQPVYIHLENARMYGPNANRQADLKIDLWRGRLTEVSGFTIGSIDFKPI